MKNLKFMFFGMLMLLSSMAMAQDNFSNTTTTYYVGAFHTTAISGCGSSALSTFYYDIPDGVIGNVGSLMDENGNATTAGNVTGITVEEFGTTNTYYVDFCSGGVVQMSGLITLPNTHDLSWFIVGTLVIINIQP